MYEGENNYQYRVNTNNSKKVMVENIIEEDTVRPRSSTEDIPRIYDSLNIEESMKDALVSIMKTSIDENETHSKLVCIVCDRFIIRTEPIHWISPNQLKVNEERLSVKIL